MIKIGEDLDPAVAERTRESFARQGLMRHLGVSITDIRAGLVTLSMPFRPELTQQHGYFHAGGTSAIADTAGGYAAHTMFHASDEVLTVEFKLNLINPAKGERLEAIGKVTKPGKTLTICHLDVWAVTGAEQVHVATGLQTLIRVPGR